jgi:hypothetical protein
MWFFLGVIIVSWILWFIFADKTRWREIFPVSFFAGYLGLITDIIMDYYRLWEYKNGKIMGELFDDFSVYIVVTYLFIQWLPTNHTFWAFFRYWFIWTATAIGIEWVHVVTDHMEHHKWWNYGWSYFANWLLFWIFYKYHKIFNIRTEL